MDVPPRDKEIFYVEYLHDQSDTRGIKINCYKRL